MNDLARFQLWLIQKGRKKSTVRLLSHTILRVQRDVGDFSKDSLTSYLFQLFKDGKSGHYLNDIINAIRSYTDFMGDKICIDYFPEKPTLNVTLSDQEIDDFLALPCPTFIGTNWNTGRKFTRRTDPNGWDIFTMFWTIMAYSGMRCGEVANLTVDTVDFQRGVYILYDTKTNDSRYVPIAECIKVKLGSYVKQRDGYLFPSRRGGKDKGPVIDSVDWGYNFHRRIDILGIKRKGLTPYSLRRSFISSLLPNSTLFDTMEIVGHKNPKTTMIYYHKNIQTMTRALGNLPLALKTPFDKLRILREVVVQMRFPPDSFDVYLTNNEVSIKIK